MKKVQLVNVHGERLVGIFHESSDPKNLVLICPGRLCTKEHFFYAHLADALANEGFNAYRFDFAGTGESGGKFEQATMSKGIEDINAVSRHFSKMGYGIYCVIGHSMGAVMALLFQAKYGLAQRVVDISGTVDQEFQLKASKSQLRELEEKGFYTFEDDGKTFKMSAQYFFDRLGYGDVREKVSRISVPVLVVHGTEDDDTPFSNGEMMSKAISKSKFVLIEGAGHRFSEHEHERKLINEIVSWLKNSGN